MQAIRSFYHDQEGGALIEYTFLASLIALAAVAAMNAVGTSLAQKLDHIATLLS